MGLLRLCACDLKRSRVGEFMIRTACQGPLAPQQDHRGTALVHKLHG